MTSARRGRSRSRKTARPGTVVLKLGGELLESPAVMKAVARTIARAAIDNGRLVVVHGGGKEIDAALGQASIPKHQVDGLRITDEATLQVVVSVLAGSINTRLVAAINAVGGSAVGLTGADAGVAPVEAAGPHRATNGELVDLGLVGEPLATGAPALVETLAKGGYVPVVACIGASRDGRLFNVNADTLAGNLAARLRARRLIIAGTTAVLGTAGETLPELDATAVDELVSSGTATAGMIAKLKACRTAVEGGVNDVIIADGRKPRRLAAILAGSARRGAWTRIVQ